MSHFVMFKTRSGEDVLVNVDKIVKVHPSTEEGLTAIHFDNETVLAVKGSFSKVASFLLSHST